MVWGLVLIAAFIAAVIGLLLYARRNRDPASKSGSRAGSNPVQQVMEEMQAKSAKRDEALFASAFPDLQPYFHPQALVEFVRANQARLKSGTVQGPFSWKRPPGFGVPLLEVQSGAERVLHELRDEAGAVLASFHYDEHPEGGVLRVGQGKFTVNVVDQAPRVRYWHPEREFKWSRNKWLFVTPLAAAAFAARADNDTIGSRDWNDDRPSRETFSGGGGSFDGGGASGGWEESKSDASSDFSSVESGSSSSAGSESSSSTGY